MNSPVLRHTCGDKLWPPLRIILPANHEEKNQVPNAEITSAWECRDGVRLLRWNRPGGFLTVPSSTHQVDSTRFATYAIGFEPTLVRVE